MGRAESDVKVDLAKAFKELGFVSADAEFKPEDALRDFARGWGPSMKNRWQQIYQIIETANSFQ